MTRTILCERTNEDGSLVVAHNLECVHTAKPPTVQDCNQDMPCAGWFVKYGQCSKKCGGGMKIYLPYIVYELYEVALAYLTFYALFCHKNAPCKYIEARLAKKNSTIALLEHTLFQMRIFVSTQVPTFY